MTIQLEEGIPVPGANPSGHRRSGLAAHHIQVNRWLLDQMGAGGVDLIRMGIRIRFTCTKRA